METPYCVKHFIAGDNPKRTVCTIINNATIARKSSTER